MQYEGGKGCSLSPMTNQMKTVDEHPVRYNILSCMTSFIFVIIGRNDIKIDISMIEYVSDRMFVDSFHLVGHRR